MKRLGIVNQGNAEALALTASTTVFAVLAIVASHYLSKAGLVLQIVSAGIGATSLGTFFIVLRRWFHRGWARPLLGIWVYRTRPHDESKRSDTGYGVAEFTQSYDGSLSYRVDLYRDPHDATAAAAGDSPDGESHGTALGLALSFDERSGALWILYQVQYYSDTDPDREGHLFVRAAGPSGHRVLRGSWASDLNGRQLSAGVMTMMRLQDVEAFVQHD